MSRPQNIDRTLTRIFSCREGFGTEQDSVGRASACLRLRSSYQLSADRRPHRYFEAMTDEGASNAAHDFAKDLIPLFGGTAPSQTGTRSLLQLIHLNLNSELSQ